MPRAITIELTADAEAALDALMMDGRSAEAVVNHALVATATAMISESSPSDIGNVTCDDNIEDIAGLA